MEKSVSISKLSTALCTFQSKIKTITNDESVSVETRNGGSYSFKYTSLAKILEFIRPIMSETKLSVSQLTELDGAVTTILMHESGEFLQSTLKLPIDITGGKNDAQKIGSAITYARRYSLSAILGIATDEDDDGNLASGNSVKKEGAPAATKNNNTDAAPSNAPWITDINLDMAILRMEMGVRAAYHDAIKAYRMSKERRAKLDAAKSRLEKEPPPTLPADAKTIQEQAALMTDVKELEKYWNDHQDMHNDYYFKRIINYRKLQLTKK